MFASAVFVTAEFASPLILEVVFKSPVMFVTEAYVKRVTAIGGQWSPQQSLRVQSVLQVFGTPVCVTPAAVWRPVLDLVYIRRLRRS